jgi:hypothetical protein
LTKNIAAIDPQTGHPEARADFGSFIEISGEASRRLSEWTFGPALAPLFAPAGF